jgi:hypothetical protein
VWASRSALAEWVPSEAKSMRQKGRTGLGCARTLPALHGNTPET